MKKTIYSLFWLLLFLAAANLNIRTANAQVVSGNAFLQGTYVELGISPCGKFGSEVNAPAGYHSNMSGPIGFVADAAGDGWATGTPNFCGDYFLPGSPEEGFGILANGITYDNYSSCAGAEMAGGITSYTATATDISAVWAGNIPAANLSVTATSRIPIGGKYIVTTVQICNTGASTVTGVYYMRNVDPDNEQPTSGDFSTNQAIVLQQPTSAQCRALVSATGQDYGCYLGLGSKDPRARVSFGGFSNTDPLEVWNGTGVLTGTLGATNANDDEAISIAFNIGDLAPGACETVAFVYILNAADLDAALDATANPQYFANGSDITTTGTATACAGNPVTLAIGNGGSFAWTWSPATYLNTTSGPSVICTPSANIVYTVTGTSACSPTVTQFITVNLVSPPVINTQPATQTACNGTPVTFSVGATSAGALTYQWQYNGTNIIGATASTYTIPAVAAGNAGNYSVVVTGGCSVNSNIATLTVLPSTVASVNVTATPSSAVCAGTVITFTATPTNGGATPAYQWYLNGTAVTGATSSTYSGSSFVTGDIVTVQMTTSATCALPSASTSAPINVTSLNVSGAVTASATSICPGDNVTFNANPSGTNPANTQYTYYVNGVAVSGPTTTSTYSSAALNDGDVVTVSMAASVGGGTTTFSTGPVSIPSSGSGTPYPSTINVSGLAGTITDVKVRFTNITHTFASDVDVLLKSPLGTMSTVFSDQGGGNDFTTTNNITFQTGGAAFPAGAITGTLTLAPADAESDNYPAPGPGAGTFPANFALFNGSDPNGVWSLFVFDDAGGDSGNIPTWELIITTTGITCSATSSAITMNIASGAASVSIAASDTDICPGESVTFTATPTNGGTPTYQWQINGADVAGATGATFTSTSLANLDDVTVIMTSSLGCVVGSPATSNVVSMTVNPAPAVTFTLPAEICSNNASFTMNGTPAGGVYSGPGVSGDVLAPGTTGAPGIKTITYTYTSGGCTVTVSQSFLLKYCGVATLPPVPAPNYLIVEGIDTHKLKLRFPDADNNESGYEIYRSSDGINFSLHKLTGPYEVTEVHYYDTISTQPDRPYYYIVRTVKNNRRSGFTNSAYDYTYPLPPVVTGSTDACVGGKGTLTATATHDSQEFRWYESETATTPLYEAGSEPYRGNTLSTPALSSATVFWVTAKGYRYESKPRVSGTVSIRQRPVVNFVDLPSTVLSCDTFYTFNVEFYAGMTYYWYNEYSQLIGTSNEPHFTVTKNGNYRLRVSDGYCDSYSTWIPVTLNYKPEAKILQGKNTVFCQSGTLFAKKINGATYSWSKDGVTIGEGEAINVNESGKYTLTVNKFGCTNTFETDVVINKIPDSFDISAENAAICPGEKTRISVSEISGATNYMWYRNGRTYRYTTANSVEIKQKGTYTVRVYFGENCGIDALVSIEVEELDAPRVRPVITTDLKINLENAAGMTYSTVKWFLYGDELTSFANQASIKPTEAGLYKAVVTYGTGCEVFSGSIYFGISGTDDEEKNPNEIRFLLYPNPTKGDLYITMNSKTTVSVNVLDQLGRILMVKEFTAEEVQNTAKLDLSALPSGVFMVKVTANGITTVRKITRD